MANPVDIAQDDNEAFRERAIEHARSTTPQLRGEPECRVCGLANDRAEAGYAVCSECVGVVA